MRYSKKKNKIIFSKQVRKVTIYHIIKINQSLNNIFITLCTGKGKVIYKISKGIAKMNFSKKRNIFLFELITKIFVKYCLRKAKSIRRNPIIVEAFLHPRRAYMLKGCIRALKFRKIRIYEFHYLYKKGYNGLRKKKKRRR